MSVFSSCEASGGVVRESILGEDEEEEKGIVTPRYDDEEAKKYPPAPEADTNARWRRAVEAAVEDSPDYRAAASRVVLLKAELEAQRAELELKRVRLESLRVEKELEDRRSRRPKKVYFRKTVRGSVLGEVRQDLDQKVDINLIKFCISQHIDE